MRTWILRNSKMSHRAYILNFSFMSGKHDNAIFFCRRVSRFNAVQATATVRHVMSISSIFSLHTQFYLCVAVSFMHISSLKAHTYIYASIFTRGRTRHFARRTPIYTGWARCVPYSHRAFVDDFQKMERTETTRRRNERVKKAWVDDRVGGKKEKE